MYKPGDRIRIRKVCKWYPWYNEEVFIVQNYWNNMVSLDKIIPNTEDVCICTDYITHEYLYERTDKILKLKKRINENR